MEEVKLSIIVPVYNAEKTLGYCVDSIINQTYKNLEIILVENGSTDRSLEMCKAYAEKDGRVKVYVSGTGVSKARNLGLENMTGEYFAFVDSDDYVDVTTYEKCLKKALETGADMTFYMINSVSEGNISEYKEPNLEKVVYDDQVRYMFYRGIESVRTVPWRTVFLTKVHKDVRFNEEMSHGEDFMYLLECMKRSCKKELLKEYLHFNVNFHHVPFLFARKYKNRYHFFESAQIFSEYAENYLKERGCEDIMYATRFDYLIMLINSIVGTEKHWYKEIRKFVKEPYWKATNNKTAYKQYMKIASTCGKVVKLKAWLVYHKLYFAYGIMAKTYARMKGVK